MYSDGGDISIFFIGNLNFVNSFEIGPIVSKTKVEVLPYSYAVLLRRLITANKQLKGVNCN